MTNLAIQREKLQTVSTNCKSFISTLITTNDKVMECVAGSDRFAWMNPVERDNEIHAFNELRKALESVQNVDVEGLRNYMSYIGDKSGVQSLLHDGLIDYGVIYMNDELNDYNVIKSNVYQISDVIGQAFNCICKSS